MVSPGMVCNVEIGVKYTSPNCDLWTTSAHCCMADMPLLVTATGYTLPTAPISTPISAITTAVSDVDQ